MPKNCAAIVIAAKHGELIKVKDYSGITDTVGALRCKFEFRTNDWDNATMTAVFCKGNMATNPEIVDGAIGVLLDSVDECAVPAEVLTRDAKYFSVGIWGVTATGLRIVSEWLVFRIKDGCYVSATEPVEPTPTVYEQIMISLNSKAPVNHKHDDIYYSKPEIDNKFATLGDFNGGTIKDISAKDVSYSHNGLPELSNTKEALDIMVQEIVNLNSSCDEFISAKELESRLAELKASGEFDGVGISEAHINEHGELIVKYSDNSTVNLGTVMGKDGANGVDGKDGIDGIGVTKTEINLNGELIIYYSDDTSTNLGKVIGSNGQDGKDGTDGIGITKTEINADGELVLTYSDNTTINLGRVVGKDGEDTSSVDMDIITEFDLNESYTDTQIYSASAVNNAVDMIGETVEIKNNKALSINKDDSNNDTNYPSVQAVVNYFNECNHIKAITEQTYVYNLESGIYSINTTYDYYLSCDDADSAILYDGIAIVNQMEEINGFQWMFVGMDGMFFGSVTMGTTYFDEEFDGWVSRDAHYVENQYNKVNSVTDEFIKDGKSYPTVKAMADYIVQKISEAETNNIVNTFDPEKSYTDKQVYSANAIYQLVVMLVEQVEIKDNKSQSIDKTYKGNDDLYPSNAAVVNYVDTAISNALLEIQGNIDDISALVGGAE